MNPFDHEIRVLLWRQHDDEESLDLVMSRIYEANRIGSYYNSIPARILQWFVGLFSFRKHNLQYWENKLQEMPDVFLDEPDRWHLGEERRAKPRTVTQKIAHKIEIMRMPKTLKVKDIA